MKILVACEESGIVTQCFREKGHDAYSCDIEPTSGNLPEYHLQTDVIPLLSEKWDMIIAFPPCTYLSVVANRVWNTPGRAELRQSAAKFFMKFAYAKCDRIAIENPVGYMNTHYRKPDQIIHPYYFGENFQKKTCLWLKNLPKLQPTNMLSKPEPMYYCQGEKSKGKAIGWVEGMRGIIGGQKERAKARSKTFRGIAEAMADQWGDIEKLIKFDKSIRFEQTTIKLYFYKKGNPPQYEP